ncbi:MAG: ribonuclease III [Proteobacteria bacterium]|nr:ribonuclease III [Pseudomonadota bacterium]
MKPSSTSRHLRKRKLTDLQAKLGYQFENVDLLDAALTHRSVGDRNNERLEFLGDAVLGYVIAAYLFTSERQFAEGDMTLARARLVRGSTLASIARDLDLGSVLNLGTGEKKSGGHQRESILADAFEAIIGAIHEDQGIGACTRVILDLYDERAPDVLTQAEEFDLKDSKTRLQEYLQARKLALPVYSIVEVSGDDHDRSYLIRCDVEALDLDVQAEAPNRRSAEKLAAAKMLKQIQKRD